MPNILGIQQTPYTEFNAYLNMIDERLDEWEVNALKQLDTTYVGLLMEHSAHGNHNGISI